MKTNGTVMQETLDVALMVGESPWKANRAAIREYDIFENIKSGTLHAKMLIDGIDLFVAKLEDFKNVSDAVSRRSASIIH